MRSPPALLAALLTFGGAPFLATLAFTARPALASSSIELTMGELVGQATLVMAGTPVEMRSLWEGSEGTKGRRIVTYTRVRVDRVIDGTPRGDVWVRTLGGEVGELGQRVEGEAVLLVDKPALLFLRALPEGPHVVVGMAQGDYPLEIQSDQALQRVAAPAHRDNLLPKLGADAEVRIGAARILPGQTLDQVAQLVAAERRAHAR